MNRNTLNAVSHMTFLKQLDWGILTAKSVVENGGAVNGDEASAAARAEIERQRLQSIPILVEKSADSWEEGSVDYVDINKLMEQLGSSLPDTKIRAFRVPVQRAPRLS